MKVKLKKKKMCVHKNPRLLEIAAELINERQLLKIPQPLYSWGEK